MAEQSVADQAVTDGRRAGISFLELTAALSSCPSREAAACPAERRKSTTRSVPEGFTATRYPCFPCHRDGKDCYVSRNRDIMPCSNAECRNLDGIACCADQRGEYCILRGHGRACGRTQYKGSHTLDAAVVLPFNPLRGIDMDDLTTKQKLDLEGESLARRILVVLLEDAHKGKEKVGGRWTEQGWTPVCIEKPSLTASPTDMSWQEAARAFDAELERDVIAFRTNEKETEKEDRVLLQWNLPTSTIALSDKRVEMEEQIQALERELMHTEHKIRAKTNTLRQANMILVARRKRTAY